MEPVDARANAIGRRQRGLVSRQQLYDEAGVSRSTVTRRLATGRWHEPLPNVIDLGTHAPSWRGEVTAALLAAGPDAWASHDTAAHIHGFLDAPRPANLDVLVPRGRHRSIGALGLHTTLALGADEVTEAHRLPCTTPARTLLDLAVGTSSEQLERYLADLARRRRSVVEEVVGLTDRHRRIPGRRRLLEVVRRLPGDVAQLGSPLEVIGVQRLRQHGAPPFVLQYLVRDESGAVIKRVDVAWPAARVLLEFDSAAYHDLVGARWHDATIRERLRALGWHVEVVRRADLDDPAFAAFVRRLRLIAA